MVSLAKKATLEGEYSNWSIYHSFGDTYVYLGLWPQLGIFNRAETELMILDIYNDVVRRYTIATKTLSAPITTTAIFGDAPWAGDLCMKSAYGTYVLLNDDYRYLKVIKSGVVIKTLTDSDLGFASAEILTASISGKGRYIAVSGQFADLSMGWVILVGS